MHRRSILKTLSVLGAATLVQPKEFLIAPNKLAKKATTIGFITDLHDMQFGHTEVPRLKAFMDEVVKLNPDFIIQCGDFCRPVNIEAVMKEWNRFPGSKYHVLGNHDMDVCDKPTTLKLWGMDSAYYSFDKGGYHFVVLDRNYLKNADGSLTDYNNSNWSSLASPFRSFSDPAQIDWLAKDLTQNKLPVVVFMHQPVFLTDHGNEIGNAADILAVFDQTNYQAEKKGNGKVIAVFMGHDHDDRYAIRNGVHYLIINSASYVYNDGPVYFKDSLFAFITLDPAGRMKIAGRTTTYRDPVSEKILARFPTIISNRDVRFT